MRPPLMEAAASVERDSMDFFMVGVIFDLVDHRPLPNGRIPLQILLDGLSDKVRIRKMTTGEEA